VDEHGPLLARPARTLTCPEPPTAEGNPWLRPPFLRSLRQLKPVVLSLVLWQSRS